MARAAVDGGPGIPYGIFQMLEPWGTDAMYQDDLG